jgi:DNA-binding response OmpR family regulator
LREERLVDASTPPAILQLGSRRVDLARRSVEETSRPGSLVDSAGVRLTRTEAAILGLLVGRAPATVTREELLRTLWNLAARSSRTLDTHVTRLRRKLEDDPAAPRFVLTVYRVGYRFEPPAQSAAIGSASWRPSAPPNSLAQAP